MKGGWPTFAGTIITEDAPPFAVFERWDAVQPVREDLNFDGVRMTGGWLTPGFSQTDTTTLRLPHPSRFSKGAHRSADSRGVFSFTRHQPTHSEAHLSQDISTAPFVTSDLAHSPHFVSELSQQRGTGGILGTVHWKL